jgi:hypothetical protein
LFTLRHSSLIIVVYRCFTTAIVHASTLSTHDCGLPMFYNRHCSRFDTLHSSLWFTNVLQPPLFTLQHSPLMIVVYRCFTIFHNMETEIQSWPYLKVHIYYDFPNNNPVSKTEWLFLTYI